jgi:hypothetical protein
MAKDFTVRTSCCPHQASEEEKEGERFEVYEECLRLAA